MPALALTAVSATRASQPIPASAANLALGAAVTNLVAAPAIKFDAVVEKTDAPRQQVSGTSVLPDSLELTVKTGDVLLYEGVFVGTDLYLRQPHEDVFAHMVAPSRPGGTDPREVLAAISAGATDVRIAADDGQVVSYSFTLPAATAEELAGRSEPQRDGHGSGTIDVKDGVVTGLRYTLVFPEATLEARVLYSVAHPTTAVLRPVSESLTEEGAVAP